MKPHKTKKFNPYKSKRYNLHIPEDMFDELKPIIKRFVTKKIKQKYGVQ